MRLRVDFSAPEDKPGYYINLILAKVIIEAVEDTIYRVPDHWIAGRYRMRLTISDLSPAEAGKLLPILKAEIPGGFIRKVTAVKSRKENDNSGYLFSQPGYVDGEKELLSKRIDKQLDIEKVIREVIEITKLVISDLDKEAPSDTPLTIKALREYTLFSNLGIALDTMKKDKRKEPECAELIEHLKPIEHLTIRPRDKR